MTDDNDEQTLVEQVSKHFQQEFNEQEIKPLLTTKMIVIVEAIASDGRPHLYSWATKSASSWDILGMMKGVEFDIQSGYFDTGE